MKRRVALTTGEVATLLGVAPRTVTKWFDAGILSGYRLPCSRDRRIHRDALLRFMREQDLPIDGPFLASLNYPVVLAVSLDRLLLQRLTASLPEEVCAVHTASCWFTAGSVAALVRPNILVIDCMLGRSISIKVAQEQTAARKIALACEDDADEESLKAHFDVVFRKPFDPQLLAEQILRYSDVHFDPQPHATR